MTSDVTLFSFSKIKSNMVFQIAEYNSFNKDLTKIEPNYDKNDDINILKKDFSPYYIKNVNIALPSKEKLKEEKFRNEFFNNYDTSFSNFCGISEKMFIEIYDKSKYNPTINQLGDIKVNIDNIIENIDKFSGNKRLKVRRTKFKRYKKLNEKKDSSVGNKTLNLFKTRKVSKRK